MAITSGGAVGSGGYTNTSNTTSWDVTGCSAAIDDEVIVIIAVDNYHTTYGYYSDVSSVMDSAGNAYSLLNDGTNDAAYVYSPTSNQNDGASVSVFKSKITSTLSSGTITITLGHAKKAKAATIWKFTVDSGNTLRCVSGKIIGKTKSNTTGSGAYLDAHTITSLASNEYLFLGAAATEVYYTIDAGFTPTSGFTAITGHSADAGAAPYDDAAAGGEFKIATTTSATSQPYIQDKWDVASLFMALKESPLVADSTGGMMLGMSF